MKKRKRRGVPRGGSSWRNMKTKQIGQSRQGADSPPYEYWWPADGPQVNCVWFYIPLRLPLKLPDRFILPIGSAYDFDYPQDDLADFIGFAGKPDNPIGVSVSICVHQIEGNASDPQSDAVHAAVQRWHGKANHPPSESPGSSIITTVLECCTSLGDMSPDGIGDSPSASDNREELEDSLSSAFDRVVREVNNLLRSYMMLTQDRVALVQKETLPASVIAEWRLGLESGPEPKETALFLINIFADLIMSMSTRRAEHLSQEQISEMLSQRDALIDPMMADIHTMTVDARLALQRGDYAVSVVLLASGCELILRLLLEVLLWEDDVSPRDAAAEIFRSSNVGHPIRHILKSKFHDRLGGVWDITASSNPAGRFYKAVFESRNRYLHTATPITGADANGAFEAATAFMEFVHERLATHLHRYPFAANVLIGEPLVSQMGIRERIDVALRDREAELPISPLMYNCWEHFIMYRQEIMRYQDSDSSPGCLMGDINEDTRIASLIYPDSSIEYWLIDPDKAVACRAEKPNMSRKQTKHIKRLAKKARRLPPNSLFTVRLMGTPARPLESSPDWVSAYEVWRMEHKQD